MRFETLPSSPKRETTRFIEFVEPGLGTSGGPKT